ncbi:flagellar protein FliT [Methylophilus medardicus]|uniref:Flagellar protein FliT n=1 Tax=Methylophilus medardicus TaxID=2588534 RepID=A0A5B8CTA7_9PROT|nr:flagellar protein FliT [Methylophilus medardicus]QDC44340.1 flagellar protein FliT [Methylophilus medardicus]QDC49347.1 flagellar protein FliT [Methylophilus medardicus]QDC53052.1 flagellar protein FliT [Methylophilus medardicus]
MSQALINTYESAAKLMEQMLIAARQNAWEKVTELEQSYMLKIEVVKSLEQSMRLAAEPLSAEQHARKQALVQKILADDGEIRNLLYPVMHRITDMIFDAQLHARMPPDGR